MQIKKYIILFCLFLNLIACDGKTEGRGGVASPNNLQSLLKGEVALTGDFNGNKKNESLYIISKSKLGDALLKTLPVKSGWPFYGEGSVPAVEAGGPLLIVIVENEKHTIIYDPNKVSILDTNSAKELFVLKQSDKENELWQEIGGAAKGDVLVIPTEAGVDSFFIWDGKRYQPFEPLEIP